IRPLPELVRLLAGDLNDVADLPRADDLLQCFVCGGIPHWQQHAELHSRGFHRFSNAGLLFATDGQWLLCDDVELSLGALNDRSPALALYVANSDHIEFFGVEHLTVVRVRLS